MSKKKHLSCHCGTVLLIAAVVVFTLQRRETAGRNFDRHRGLYATDKHVGL